MPVGERGASEVTEVGGGDEAGNMRRVQITPDGSGAANPALDVTPARLVTGLITEKGGCPATQAGLLSLFPEFG